MKIKTLSKLCLGLVMLGSVAGLTSCKAGLTYEEAPENIYSEVGLSAFTVRSRQLFENQVWGVNYDQWVPEVLYTVVVGGSSSIEWTNETGSDYMLEDGMAVAPGQTVTLSGTMTEESDASAPDGVVTVLHSYVLPEATYTTENKGFVFDGSKFSGEFELVDPTNNQSQSIKLPIKQNELICDFTLVDYDACTVEPQDDAPALGIPADYTQSRRYLVRNNRTHRPAGVEEYRRLYEVRLTFLP